MFLRRIAVQNFRSFREKEELILDGSLSIIIGPNGGGKTNLLDICMLTLQIHFIDSLTLVGQESNQKTLRFQPNNLLDTVILDGQFNKNYSQLIIDFEIEVTTTDIKNLHLMKPDVQKLLECLRNDNYEISWVEGKFQPLETWNLTTIKATDRFSYQVTGNQISLPDEPNKRLFLEFLQLYELYNDLRSLCNLKPFPMLLHYFPINRTASVFSASIQLAGSNEYSLKKQYNRAHSRETSPPIATNLAMLTLAKKHRFLESTHGSNAIEILRNESNLQILTRHLQTLGYEWSLHCTDPLNNTYEIKVEKQGVLFSIDQASTGEKQLLNYLFSIFVLDIRGALIVIDEPELHLHPKWQKTLLKLFIELAEETGNQFLLATHSPTFISPQSVQYVSRVYSQNQVSRITRLQPGNLPGDKHLFNMINSQNNERLFFADKVVLVEGLSDQMFFEAWLDKQGRDDSSKVIEVISVGGKSFFKNYQTILSACKIEYAIIADLDYIENIAAPSNIKSLLELNAESLKKKCLQGDNSKDGKALVQSIDEAMQNENWDHAKETWKYIKSRHLKVRNNLNPEEQSELDKYIQEQQEKNLFILSKGALEDYLPKDYQNLFKDTNKLIEFLNQPDFDAKLSSDIKPELESIAKKVINCDTTVSVAVPVP